MTTPVYFIESNFLIDVHKGKIFQPCIYPIKTFWQRIIVNLVHFIRLGFVPSKSLIVAPRGLFWIPCLYKKIRLKKFYIISLSTDTFLSEKTITLRNKGFLFYLKYLLAKWTYNYVDIYLYSSNVVKEQLEYFGVPKEKLGGKYDIWIMDKHRLNIRSQRDINLPSNNFLFIGHYYISNQKRLDILIDAFLKLKKEGVKDTTLHVVGAHREKYFGKEKINVYIKEGIIFYGFCYELDSLIQQCSFYVHPGEGEAISTAVLEAMLAGRVTIVSSRGGEREAVGKVDQSFVIDLTVDAFYNKMKEVINLPLQERNIIGEQCRVIAKEYNEENAKKVLNNAFNTIYIKYKG